MQITIWQVMVAVGVVALLLAAEPWLFRYAANVVMSGDEQYIWGEALAVWIILNAALSPLIGLPVLVVWAHKNERNGRGECKA